MSNNNCIIKSIAKGKKKREIEKYMKVCEREQK